MGNHECLSKKVLEGNFREYRFWLGDLGENLKKQGFTLDWVLVESRAIL